MLFLFIIAPNAYPTPPTPTLPHPKDCQTQPKKTEKENCKEEEEEEEESFGTLHTPLERGTEVATQRLELGSVLGGVNW
jgi:hypothetical protein